MYICFARSNDEETVVQSIDCLPEHAEKPVIQFINENYVSDYNLGSQRILTEAVMDRLEVCVSVPELDGAAFYTKRKARNPHF